MKLFKYFLFLAVAGAMIAPAAQAATFTYAGAFNALLPNGTDPQVRISGVAASLPNGDIVFREPSAGFLRQVGGATPGTPDPNPLPNRTSSDFANIFETPVTGDLSFSSVSATVGSTSVSAGDLLVFTSQRNNGSAANRGHIWIYDSNGNQQGGRFDLNTNPGGNSDGLPSSNIIGGTIASDGSIFVLDNLGNVSRLDSSGAVQSTFSANSVGPAINFAEGDIEFVENNAGGQTRQALLVVGGGQNLVRRFELDGTHNNDFALPTELSGVSLTGLGVNFDPNNGIDTAWFSSDDGNLYAVNNFVATAVPEPGTFALLGLVSAAGFVGRRRLKKVAG